MRCISRILTVFATALAVSVTAAQAQPAPDGNSVLILGTTVSGGAGSQEAVAAAALGLTVVVDDPVAWSLRTTADFATFQAIILGDPTCGETPAPYITAAEANRTIWSPAITGNMVIIGTDPTFHSKTQVPTSGIAFAVDAPTTGAYITLSCYYHSAPPGTPVPLLDQFGTGFTVVGQGGCPADSHIVASHPALAGLTDAYLSNWGCSTHEGFVSWPSEFLVLVISEDVPSTYVAGDGSTGAPYIMARGEELVPVACGDGDLDPGETCDDGNTNNGDGCSAQCQIEVPVCGDGTVDPEIGEECDDGNTVDGDGCSANCTIEPYCGDGTVDPGEQCDDGNNTSGDGCSASCEIENEAPVCDDATAAISSIWPPNHKMVSVGPITGVTDPDGDPVKITVTHIMQDEPTNTQGDGNTSCDATTAPLQVRAERSGTRDGRFYHAVFTATDPGGLSCTGSVVVAVVPHDQSHAPVDQGPLYNSCPAP